MNAVEVHENRHLFAYTSLTPRLTPIRLLLGVMPVKSLSETSLPFAHFRPFLLQLSFCFLLPLMIPIRGSRLTDFPKRFRLKRARLDVFVEDLPPSNPFIDLSLRLPLPLELALLIELGFFGSFSFFYTCGIGSQSSFVVDLQNQKNPPRKSPCKTAKF